MLHINITIIPNGEKDYSLEINTDLPEENLVKKILEECLDMWNVRTSEGFEEGFDSDLPSLDDEEDTW